MPLTGKAKTDYQRVYMRGRQSKHVQEVAGAIKQALKPSRGRPRALTESVEDAAQAGLALALRANKLGLDRVLTRVSDKLDATRWFNASKVVNGKSVTEAILAGDNDAQLRAADLALKLHERAGTIPVTEDSGQHGALITVNILHFDLPDVVVEPKSGDDNQTVDAQVIGMIEIEGQTSDKR